MIPSEVGDGGRKLLRSILLVIVLLGGGTGIAWLLYSLKDEPPRRQDTLPPPVVRVVELQPELVVERFNGYGTALPDRAATLAAQVSSIVIERVNDIEPGSAVQKGQPLIRLDPREFQLRLDRARALVAADQAGIDEQTALAIELNGLMRTAGEEVRVTLDEKKRVSALFEETQATRKEFDFANLSYQRARRIQQQYAMELAAIAPRKARFEAGRQGQLAAVELARLNVDRCTITAPFTGVIQTLLIDVGDHVGPGSPMLRLIDPSRVEIPIQLPNAVYDRVAIGGACTLSSEAQPGTQWYGRIARKAPLADEQTRTFSVYIDVDNTAESVPLVPGIFVRADVEGSSHANRLLVPRSAIRKEGVLIAKNGVATRRSVTVERLIQDKALVEGELVAGDLVILSHLERLHEGSPVRIATGGTGHTAAVPPRPHDPPEALP